MYEKKLQTINEYKYKFRQQLKLDSSEQDKLLNMNSVTCIRTYVNKKIHMQKLNEAATLVQRHLRNVIRIKQDAVIKEEEERPIVCIQRFWKSFY